MKQKKVYKKILSVVMAITMIFTSLPLIFVSAAGGEYDPVPTFKKDKDGKVLDAIASANDKNGITVTFPVAEANKTIKGKTIEKYLLRLSELGANGELHNEKLLYSKVVSEKELVGSTRNPNYYETKFTAAEVEAGINKANAAGDISTASNTLLDKDKRYNVSIIAIDSDGWMSDYIDTIVSNVPKFVYDAETYKPLVTHPNAMREMMTFEGGGGNRRLGMITAPDDALIIGGIEEFAGTRDPGSNMDTNALRLRIEKPITQNSQYAFDTALTRQTWDYVGAEEVWFWLDLSQVELTGLSFRLRANEKVWKQVAGFVDNYTETADYPGNTIFSTKGYTGNDGFVYVQREDGGWNKVALENGTIDLGKFRGYVRIPLEFMCAEEDAYITVNRDQLLKRTPHNGWDSDADLEAKFNSFKLAEPQLAIKKGESVTTARLLQHRALEKGVTDIWHFYLDETTTLQRKQMGASKFEDMCANGEIKLANMEFAAFDYDQLEQDPITPAPKAIEDIYSAGFAFTGCSSDSVEKAIFLDNIMFYRTDGGLYKPNNLDGIPSQGLPVSRYYNYKLEVPRNIFKACEKYFENPNMSDYRAVAYIDAMIAGYDKAYKDAGIDDLDLTFYEPKSETDMEAPIPYGLDKAAHDLDMERAWHLYKIARFECKQAETYGRGNNGADDLIPKIEETMEKLPSPESFYAMNDNMKAEVRMLYHIYNKLNGMQLKSLGLETERRLIEYFKYMDKEHSENTIAVGQVLTNKPFIPFNDFENNALGSKSYQLENDPTPIGNSGFAHTDYRYYKNFVSFVPRSFIDLTGLNNDDNTSGQHADSTMDGFKSSLLHNGAWARITNEGFHGSQAATMTIDNPDYRYQNDTGSATWHEGSQGSYNVMSFTYNSQERDKKSLNGQTLPPVANTMGSLNLGSLAKHYDGTEDQTPLSLVMYVDFSQLKDFKFTCTISTFQDGVYEDYAMDMGGKSHRKFYLIDPETGEWVACNNTQSQYSFMSFHGINRVMDPGENVEDYTPDVPLSGYKGYIMIPLYHFKRGGNALTIAGDKLDESAVALNNIWRVSVGVAPGSCIDDEASHKAAVAMAGKTYTVDNIGFSYEKDFYDANGTRNDKNFDEIFDAKSLSSEDFENKVSIIDPYGSRGAFESNVNNAYATYNALSSYQKGVKADGTPNVPSVARAKARLDFYKECLDGTKQLPEASVDGVKTNVDDLKARVNALPKDVVKDANTAGDFELPYPGYVRPAPDQPIRVNFEKYGFESLEQINTVISMFEDGYRRFSNAQKQELKDTGEYQKLVNAYSAAKRCDELQSWIKHTVNDESGTPVEKGLRPFTNELINLYRATDDRYDKLTADGKATPLLSIKSAEDVQRVRNLMNDYHSMNYYAKKLLAKSVDLATPDVKGGIGGFAISESLSNVPEAVNSIKINASAYTLDNGETVNGGIRHFIDRANKLKDSLKSSLDKSVILTSEQIDEFKMIVNEYKTMHSKFYDIVEMNDAVANLVNLFEVHKTKVDVRIIKLRENTLTGSTTFSVDYSEQLPTKEQLEDIYIAVSSAYGGMKVVGLDENAYPERVGYTLMAGGKTIAPTKKGEVLVPLTEYLVKNNDANNLTVKFDATVNSKDIKPGNWEDVITVTLVKKDGSPVLTGYTIDSVTGVKTDGKPVTASFKVTYSGNDSYTVTIPADQKIDWGSPTYDASYSVETSLALGSTVSVSVKDTGGHNEPNTMICDETPEIIKYTSENFDTAESFRGINPEGTKPQNAPTIKVINWNECPPGKYTTKLTYTVEYKEATTP